MRGERLGGWQWELGKEEWECGEGVYGLAGELGQGLGCVQGQTIGLHPGQRFLQVQSVLLQRQSQGVVLRCHATSTGVVLWVQNGGEL